MDYENKVLNVAAEQWLPWVKLTVDEKGNLGVLGLAGLLMEVIAEGLHVSYKILQPKDHLWGHLQPDGNWSGLVGMIDREEAPMAIGPFIPSMERKAAVDFSYPIYFEEASIFVERPKVEITLFGLVKTFTIEVWLSILVSCIAMAVILSFSSNKERIFVRENGDLGLSKSCLLVVMAILTQGSNWLPPGPSSRFLVVIWLATTLILTKTFSGILTAMLTFPTVRIPIDSMEDLVEQTKIPWKMAPGSADNNGICQHYAVREIVFTGSLMTLAFRKNFSLQENVNSLIMKVMEAGLMKHWIHMAMPNSTVCMRSPSKDKEIGMEALKIEVFGGIFIIYAAGIAASFIVFATELIAFKVRKRS